MDSKSLRDTFYRYLYNFLAKDESTATAYDRYLALAYAVRSELMRNWISTAERSHKKGLRRIYFLSTEYILGKSLFQNMLSLGIENEMAQAVRSLGFSIEDLYAQEDDFMLGNGSEARLAACMLESMATQELPAMAYGLRYDYAQFQQEIRGGTQVERPNDWLQRGHPWEILRPEYGCSVMFGGECRQARSNDPLGPYKWKGAEVVQAVPYDVPIVGYRNGTVNTLRLWSSWASEEFLPDYLNHGDYERACEEKSRHSRITQALFPDEDVRRATDLRMKQQYFFVCATIQDIIRRFKRINDNIQDLDKNVAIHLGGSRCALAIPELMRILVDVEQVPWMRAWEMTRNIFSYTSHAISRDDSEIWPVYKVGQILPRHLQIIFDVNQTHLDEVRKKYGFDSGYIRDLSLVEEGEVKRIRFADIAVLASYSVNGVSREQTELLRKKVFAPYAMHFPERFSCKVNGISHRRWLLTVNRPLAHVIAKYVGDAWVKNPELLGAIEKLTDDEHFLEMLSVVKKSAKSKAAVEIRAVTGCEIGDAMMFDVQMGKIHTNKRQMLHILYILHCYLKLRRGETLGTQRLHIFAGKAAPSDFLAKQIIHLISAIADLINTDPLIAGSMRVVFIPNLSMTWAERLAPAVDLSEQLPTATLEPSGTFNMKFALNGAITIASLSGANIELAEKIGAGQIFTFGKTGDEIQKIRDYHPSETLARDERLKAIFGFLENEFLPKVPQGHAIYPLLSSLRDADRQFVLYDFDDYLQKQAQVDALYADRKAWMKTSLLNIARIGWFSIDRAVGEYARDIWKVPHHEKGN
jgi:glycogen phosphorylase